MYNNLVFPMQTEHVTSESWPEFRDRIFGSAHWNWLDGNQPEMISTLKQIDSTLRRGK